MRVTVEVIRPAPWTIEFGLGAGPGVSVGLAATDAARIAAEQAAAAAAADAAAAAGSAAGSEASAIAANAAAASASADSIAVDMAEARVSGLVSGLRRTQIIAGKGALPGAFHTDAGGTTISHDIQLAVRNGLVPASNVRLLLGNFYAGTAVDTDVGNDITVRAAITTTEGADLTVPLTFGGALSAVLADKSSPRLSDALGVALTPGKLFGVRLNVGITTGQKYPHGYNIHGGVTIGGEATVSEFSLRNAGPTVVNGTGWSAGSPVFGYTPLAVVGEVSEPSPAIVILGDSIAYGSGDNTALNLLLGGSVGYVSRGLRLSDDRLIPASNMSKAGQALNGWNTGLMGLDMHRRMAVCEFANTAFVHCGTNDLVATPTLGDMQTYYLTLWADLRRRGLQVAQGKIMPRVTGTYATPGGQTYLNANFTPGGLRDQLNTWFDTQVGGAIDWVVDANAYVEDADNPCKWKTSGGALTDDGVHPNAAGHQAGALAVQAWAEALAEAYGL